MSFRVHVASVLYWLQDSLASVAGFDQVLRSQATLKRRAELERILMLLTATELAGLSLAPADLAVRLLPFCVPHVFQWQRAKHGLQDFTGEIKGGC